MNWKLYISNLFKFFLLSGIYLSFFAVQIFFNFDIAHTKIGQHHTVNNSTKNYGAHTFTTNQVAKYRAKANVRLNKRFEPTSFALCAVPVIEFVSIVFVPQKWVIQNAPLYFDTKLVSTFFRGPPVIA